MEQSSLPYPQQRVIGRKVIIFLPVIAILAAIISTFMLLPKSYYLKVRDGEIFLVEGYLSSWVSSPRSSCNSTAY